MRRSVVAGAALAGIVGLAAGAVVAVAWVASERAIHPEVRTAEGPEFDPASYGFPFEVVRFPAADGVEIEAWWFPGTRREAVVAVHGFRYGRESVMPNVNVLRAAGYSVLAPTLRGSAPPPDRRETSLGYFEQRDVLGAVRWLRAQPGVDPGRIALLGISMGAATVLMAGADDAGVVAVVAEAPFENVPALIGDTFQHYLGIPPYPFGPVTVWFAQVRAGIDTARIDPLGSASRLGRPLLLIHGLDDTAIDYRNSVDIFQAVRDQRGLWLVPAGRHADAAIVDPAGYSRRVLAFLDAAFTGRPLPAVVDVARTTTAEVRSGRS